MHRVSPRHDLGSQRTKVWVDAALKLNTTDASRPPGGVAFGGVASFDNLKIGYDTQRDQYGSVKADDDIDDAGDDLVVNETFASTSVTVVHDDAGNLVDDGVFVYQYDAWNRLVLVRSSTDADITIQTAEFDGLGRRMKKVATTSGDLDGTTVYIYDAVAASAPAGRICETRDGSGNMVAQFIHSAQYIDELVMMQAAGKGDLYIHQDANWNVIGVTDLGGNLIERYVLTPYGELTVQQLSSYDDRTGFDVVTFGQGFSVAVQAHGIRLDRLSIVLTIVGRDYDRATPGSLPSSSSVASACSSSSAS